MVAGKEIFVIIAGYLIGCICTGYYLVRFRTGHDIRKCGSGSVGARNVSRTLGRSGYAITLALDIIRGLVAVGLAVLLSVDRWAVMITFLAVVCGHIWPIQLHFQGGKGVAITLGAMLIFDYRILVVLVASSAFLYLFTRRYIISGACGLLTMPLMAFILKYPTIEMIGVIMLVLIILYAHRKNIYDAFYARNR